MINKVFLFLLVIFINLQMLSINFKNQFGISFAAVLVVTYAIFLQLKSNRPIYKIKEFSTNNRWLLIYLIAFFVLFLFNFFFKETTNSIFLLKSVKYIMILSIIFCTFYIFYHHLTINNAFSALAIISSFGFGYGIYQIIAPYFDFPYFMNVFANNPSYGGNKSLYAYFLGSWNGLYSARIYGVFSEPSFYGIFVVLLVLILLYCRIEIRYKLIFFALATINIYFTYSRIAWLGLFIILFNWFLINILQRYWNTEKIKKFYLGILILLPFILYLLNLFLYSYVFSDLSMSGRFLSQKFYLNYFLTDANKLFGIGAGGISDLFQGSYQEGILEPFAHNAFIQVLTEFGIMGLLVFFSPVVIMLIKYPSELTYNLSVFLFFIFTFGELYMVESLIIIIIIIYAYIVKIDNFKRVSHK